MKNQDINISELTSKGVHTLFDMALIDCSETDRMMAGSNRIAQVDYRAGQERLYDLGLRQGMTLEELEEKMIGSLAGDAIAVQDACNLSGVVNAYGKVLSDMRWLMRQKSLGDDWLHSHCIIRAWADKIGHLTGLQAFDGEGFKNAGDAHSRCTAIAQLQEERGGDRG